MAYTLSNKHAKNLCKRTVPLQIIIKNVVTCFFGTQCSVALTVSQSVKCVFLNTVRLMRSTPFNLLPF